MHARPLRACTGLNGRGPLSRTRGSDFQISSKTVKRRAQLGRDPRTAVGSQWRFSRQALIDWLDPTGADMPRHSAAMLEPATSRPAVGPRRATPCAGGVADGVSSWRALSRRDSSRPRAPGIVPLRVCAREFGFGDRLEGSIGTPPPEARRRTRDE